MNIITIVIPIKYQLWVSFESLQYGVLLLYRFPAYMTLAHRVMPRGARAARPGTQPWHADTSARMERCEVEEAALEAASAVGCCDIDCAYFGQQRNDQARVLCPPPPHPGWGAAHLLCILPHPSPSRSAFSRDMDRVSNTRVPAAGT